MKMIMIWPEVFENPDLVATEEPRSLCSQAMCAWANYYAGQKIPDNFGNVMVAISNRLGMSKAATAENLTAHAIAKGWIKS